MNIFYLQYVTRQSAAYGKSVKFPDIKTLF